MPLRLLRLIYAAWVVGVLWLSYFSIVRFQRDRLAGGLLSRFVLALFWPLVLLTERGRLALIPK